jgi:hypothetical protein
MRNATVLFLLVAGCGAPVPGDLTRGPLDVGNPALDGAPDALLRWNANASRAIVTLGGNSPIASGILLAMVQAAVYDAVNSIDGGTHLPYASIVAAPADADPSAAIAQAAHDVIVSTQPLQTTFADTQLAADLAAIPDGQAKTDGISVGAAAAAALLQNRANSGLFAKVPFTYPPPDPGNYQPTPPLFGKSPVAPWGAVMVPFALASADQFRPGPPPDLGSKKWEEVYNLTKTLGDINAPASVRDATQAENARFWTENTPQQYNRAIRNHITVRGMNLRDAARLEAWVNIAEADSFIACWDGKYHYLFWRPVTAIRAGGGNPNLEGNPTWTPFQATPVHPEYPAAHGCVSTAVADSLAAFFHDDKVTFTMDSTVTGVTHTYDTYSAIGQSAGIARIYGGMHYLSSVETGQDMGQHVVNYMKDVNLLGSTSN